MIVGNAISKTCFILLAAGAQAADIRFEKFNFTSSNVASNVRVEKDIKFPIDQENADYLRKNSRSVSVVLYEDRCENDVNIEEALEALKDKGLFPPTHPEDEDFWPEFHEVVNAQVHVKRKKENPCMRDPIADVMPAMTQLWRGFGILDVAEAVHDEFPGIYHNQMIANWLARPGYLNGSDIIPKTGMIDFLRGPVFLSDMIGYAIRAVGECNFTLKWKVGRARPEEVALKAVTTGIAKIPEDTLTLLKEMDFKTATEFTAYDEGSPTHPSWPAMHSAASAGSYWLDITMDLTEEQLCEARMLDYSVSYARTVAGVHYRTDNEAGLMVGQEILSQTLPTYLHEVYGANKKAVEKLAKDKLYNWTTFTDSDCYKKAMYKTVTPAKPAFCFDTRVLPIEPVAPVEECKPSSKSSKKCSKKSGKSKSSKKSGKSSKNHGKSTKPKDTPKEEL